MRKLNRKGFTLVEIMIVVAIIGLLAAIAIPNFVRARQTALRNTCIANQKQIDGAVQVWAIDTGATEAGQATVSGDLVPTYIKRWPSCSQSAYAVPVVSGSAVCPAGHADHTY